MSIKKLHREILLSSVYQLSTENDPANFAKDSGNRFYWRADRKRMDAEQLRDSVMQVAGNLDNALGGPSEDLTPAMTRRTVYGRVSRPTNWTSTSSFSTFRRRVSAPRNASPPPFHCSGFSS